jgi:hypothetical protein
MKYMAFVKSSLQTPSTTYNINLWDDLVNITIPHENCPGNFTEEFINKINEIGKIPPSTPSSSAHPLPLPLPPHPPPGLNQAEKYQLIGVKYNLDEGGYTDTASDNSIYLKRNDTLIIYNENFVDYLDKKCISGTGNGNLRKYRSDSTDCVSNRTTDGINAFIYGIPTGPFTNDLFNNTKMHTNGQTYKSIIDESINAIINCLNNNPYPTIKYVLWSIEKIEPDKIDTDYDTDENHIRLGLATFSGLPGVIAAADYITSKLLNIFTNRKYYFEGTENKYKSYGTTFNNKYAIDMSIFKTSGDINKNSTNNQPIIEYFQAGGGKDQAIKDKINAIYTKAGWGRNLDDGNLEFFYIQNKEKTLIVSIVGIDNNDGGKYPLELGFDFTDVKYRRQKLYETLFMRRLKYITDTKLKKYVSYTEFDHLKDLQIRCGMTLVGNSKININSTDYWKLEFNSFKLLAGNVTFPIPDNCGGIYIGNNNDNNGIILTAGHCVCNDTNFKPLRISGFNFIDTEKRNIIGQQINYFGSKVSYKDLSYYKIDTPNKENTHIYILDNPEDLPNDLQLSIYSKMNNKNWSDNIFKTGFNGSQTDLVANLDARLPLELIPYFKKYTIILLK